MLGAAIILEVIGSACLLRSEQFSRVGPTVCVIILYGASFYCLSHALKTIPLGIAYAVWSGIGIVLTAGVGFVLFRQSFDVGSGLGIALIVIGVIIICLASELGHAKKTFDCS